MVMSIKIISRHLLLRLHNRPTNIEIDPMAKLMGELAKVLAKPLKSSQLELEIMTRDRDFEIDPEWRRQPWMQNFSKKFNLNK